MTEEQAWAWFKYRLVTHPHMHLDPWNIDDRMSLDDVREAHEILDKIDLEVEKARREHG